jgi:hypothetical protein
VVTRFSAQIQASECHRATKLLSQQVIQTLSWLQDAQHIVTQTGQSVVRRPEGSVQDLTALIERGERLLAASNASYFREENSASATHRIGWRLGEVSTLLRLLTVRLLPMHDFSS